MVPGPGSAPGHVPRPDRSQGTVVRCDLRAPIWPGPTVRGVEARCSGIIYQEEGGSRVPKHGGMRRLRSRTAGRGGLTAHRLQAAATSNKQAPRGPSPSITCYVSYRGARFWEQGGRRRRRRRPPAHRGGHGCRVGSTWAHRGATPVTPPARGAPGTWCVGCAHARPPALGAGGFAGFGRNCCFPSARCASLLAVDVYVVGVRLLQRVVVEQLFNEVHVCHEHAAAAVALQIERVQRLAAGWAGHGAGAVLWVGASAAGPQLRACGLRWVPPRRGAPREGHSARACNGRWPPVPAAAPPLLRTPHCSPPAAGPCRCPTCPR